MTNKFLSLPAQSNSDSESSNADLLAKSSTGGSNTSQNISKYKSKTEIKKAVKLHHKYQVQ